MSSNTLTAREETILSYLERFALWSRYSLFVLYAILMAYIFPIILKFIQVLLGLHPDLTEHLFMTFELLDVVMIANLVWFISAGSFYVFIHATGHEDGILQRPNGLRHISAGLQKEKMAGSIVGIASIYLLQEFLKVYESADPIVWDRLLAMLAIYGAFLASFAAYTFCNACRHHQH